MDTGVSGRVAQAIAEKIYRVSVGSQVLCITHLPQVASMADAHLFIRKQIANERTTTTVNMLNKEEKGDRNCPNDFRCGNYRLNNRTRKRAPAASEHSQAFTGYPINGIAFFLSNGYKQGVTRRN
ncbi:hypothetical protein GCM10020331_041080 [Ectobacillus funiculus]